ncbi:MAG TPA: DUF2269 domain-containing protein [Rudaea sp.]|nr:DUF2269 domain-containing protein [Rudaea sp.]
MTAYALVKLLHVVSSTLLFGTGLGTAFFMWTSHRSGDVQAIAHAARLTVLADGLFTAPAVVVQPLTGVWLAMHVGYPFGTPWLTAAIALYVLAGACWLPVVVLQLRARDLSLRAVRDGAGLPPAYFRCMRWWFVLGWPAFAAVLATFWLMVAKPVLW